MSKVLLPLAVLLIAVAVTAVMIMNRPQAMQQTAPPQLLQVEVLEVEPQSVVFHIDSHGEVTPRTETTLTSEVSGQIEWVSPSFVSGGFFAANDILLRIDARNYETAVKRARANVARARTQVSTENALAGYALKDWQRLNELRATSKEASDLTLRKPQLAEAIAELESAEADLEKAVRDLERTVIRAPYAGMVRSKQADVGQFVNTGTPLVSIFATDFAEVRLPLSQQDLAFIAINDIDSGEQTAAVELSTTIGNDEQRWTAQINRTEGVFDSASRVLHAVARVADPYRLTQAGEPLRVGSFVQARIEGKSAAEVFVIPRQAVYRNTQVWVVDDDDTLAMREVRVVRTDADQAYIDQGLKRGDRVCLSRLTGQLPGTRVVVQDA